LVTGTGIVPRWSSFIMSMTRILNASGTGRPFPTATRMGIVTLATPPTRGWGRQGRTQLFKFVATEGNRARLILLLMTAARPRFLLPARLPRHLQFPDKPVWSGRTVAGERIKDYNRFE